MRTSSLSAVAVSRRPPVDGQPQRSVNHAGAGPFPEPVPHWNRLSKGDEVAVCAPGTPILSGKVDMVALDGSVFWILQKDGLGRATVCRGEQLAVYRTAAARGRRPGGHHA